MKTIALLLALLIASQAAVQRDLVTNLTDITGYDKPWYSGYFNISTSKAKMMSHYWFFPSQSGNQNDPVILWLNGGPGCSSLMGATQEHGPFLFKANSTEIKLNPYSWNNNAHVIYIESPPGVGYSTSTDKKWNDDKTASANLHSVLEFFRLYSEYKQNEFYIAGESYAGIYVPYLATAILKHNRQGRNVVNLKGTLVGNGCTDPLECQFQALAQPFNFATMAAQGWYTPEIKQKFEQKCGSWVNPDAKKLASDSCTYYYLTQVKKIGNNVNIYNIIGTCYHQTMPGVKGQMDDMQEEAYDYWMGVLMENQRQKKLEEEFEEEEELLSRRRVLEQAGNSLPPCTDGIGPLTFFNDNSVKAALHVDKNIEWKMCTNGQGINYTRSTTGSLHLYPGLIDAGLRVWKYSGDTDGAVPIGGTLYWLDKLNKQQQYSDIVPWRAWYTEGELYGKQPGNRQNAGQFWKTEGITFVTHKGCGHMVPEDNPVSAYAMINAFLKGEDLPAY